MYRIVRRVLDGATLNGPRIQHCETTEFVHTYYKYIALRICNIIHTMYNGLCVDGIAQCAQQFADERV